jgi:Restriction endonuclease
MPVNMDWKAYEQFVAQLFKDIDPSLEVEHDAFINGRQIDVSLRKKIAGIDILIIIQAKWYKKAVPIGDVDQLESVVRETGAARGILVANKGFTTPAKVKAAKAKIELYSAYDSSKAKYSNPTLVVPVVKTTADIQLKVRHNFNAAKAITIDAIGMKLPALLFQEFIEKWQSNRVSKLPGNHSEPMDGPAIFIPESSSYYAQNRHVNIGQSSFEYTVKYKFHFRWMTPDEYRGMHNYVTENFAAASIKFNDVAKFEDHKDWERVDDLSNISVKVSHLKLDFVNTDLFRGKLISASWVNQ